MLVSASRRNELPWIAKAVRIQRKVRDREDALASTRDACAPRNLLCQLVEIFDERHCCAVEVLDFWVRRFDDVIFVRCMRAAAVPESEMSGCQLKRFAGEDVTGIGAGVARPE